MLFQVGIGSLGGTVFFQVELCTPLRPMIYSTCLYNIALHAICFCDFSLGSADVSKNDFYFYYWFFRENKVNLQLSLTDYIS